MKNFKHWSGILGMFLLALTIILVTTQITRAQENKNSYDKTLDKASEATSTVYNDLKSLSPKMGNAINEVAKELKTGVNGVWDILVKQQLVWSIAFLILTLSAIINWFVFYKRYLNKSKTIEKIVLEKDMIVDKEVINPNFSDYDARNYPHRATAQKTLIEKQALGKEQYVQVINTDIQDMPKFKYLHLIICLTLSAFSFYHFNDMLTGFINPKYGAMKTIAEIAYRIK